MYILLDSILIATPQVKYCYISIFPHEEQTRRAHWHAQDRAASKWESPNPNAAAPGGVRRGQQTFHSKPLFQNRARPEGFKNRDAQDPSELTVRTLHQSKACRQNKKFRICFVRPWARFSRPGEYLSVPHPPHSFHSLGVERKGLKAVLSVSFLPSARFVPCMETRQGCSGHRLWWGLWHMRGALNRRCA